MESSKACSLKPICTHPFLKHGINDNLLSQAQALYCDMITRSALTCNQFKLGDLILSANTGGDAIQKVPIVDYDTGIKCARVGDITNSRDYPSWSYCKADKATFENFKLLAGDILVTRTATLGVTQYISKDISAVYNNGLIRLRIDSAKASSLFVYWAINTKEFMEYISRMNSATSVRPNMKIEYLLDYPLLVPTLDLQSDFNRKIDVLMKNTSLNNNVILKLKELQSVTLSTISSR